MSFYEYVPETNTLYAVRGSTKAVEWKRRLRGVQPFDGIAHVSDTKRGACVEIENFLDENQHAGALGEDAFKTMLERCAIPFLYIGQGPFGLDLSHTLKRDAGAKRADFLISLADVGHVLVDVKVRRKIGFPDDAEMFFSLATSEMDALWKLQQVVGIQVWIAFAERGSDGRPLPGFALVAISKIREYWNGVAQRIGKQCTAKVKQIRVPDSLLQFCGETLEFNLSWWKVPGAVLDGMAQRIQSFHEDLDRELIQAERTCATDPKIVDEVFGRYHPWIQKNEVDLALKVLRKVESPE